MSVGARLKAILSDRGISQKTIAEKSGVNQSTINRLINSPHYDIRRTNLAAIARALRVHISELTGEPKTDPLTPKSISDYSIKELAYELARQAERATEKNYDFDDLVQTLVFTLAVNDLPQAKIEKIVSDFKQAVSRSRGESLNESNDVSAVG